MLPSPVRRRAGCVHTPNFFRNRTGHHPRKRDLALSVSTVALSTPYRELWVDPPIDAAVFALCYGPIRCKAPGPPTSALTHRAAEPCTSGLSPCESPPQGAGQHYRGKLGDSAGRTLTDWVNSVTGCNLRRGVLRRWISRCFAPSVAFARFRQARLPLAPLAGLDLSTRQASLHVTGW